MFGWVMVLFFLGCCAITIYAVLIGLAHLIVWADKYLVTRLGLLGLLMIGIYFWLKMDGFSRFARAFDDKHE